MRSTSGTSKPTPCRHMGHRGCRAHVATPLDELRGRGLPRPRPWGAVDDDAGGGVGFERPGMSRRRQSRNIRSIAAVPSELMPAAVYVGDGKIVVEEVPCPEPAPGEVLVEIAECGICGSDLHMVLERYAKPGAILGHEWSGIVASAPSGSGWSAGDRVVDNPPPGCGVCRPCRRGRPAVCLNRAPANFLGHRGAFCRYKTVAADSLIRIPDSMPTRVAALDRTDGHHPARAARLRRRIG